MYNISDSEYEVMNIIWSEHPVSSGDIIEQLSAKMSWTPQTIKTLINRLLKKEIISFEKQGRHYLYSPVIDKDEYLKNENKSFVKKFYDNSISQVVNHFVKSTGISKDEIDALRQLLDEVEDE